MNILGIQLGTELGQLLVLLLQLCRQVLNGTLQLVALERTLTELLLQLVDKLTAASWTG